MSDPDALYPKQRAALDAGLFVLRLGIGIIFIRHGWPKLTGGAEGWAQLGAVMGMIGIDVLPAFWGFMAAFAEVGGGIALIVGLLFRPFAFMMLFVMVMAVAMKMTGDAPAFGNWAYPAAMGVVFLSLLIAGPGKVALGRLLFKGRCWA